MIAWYLEASLFSSCISGMIIGSNDFSSISLCKKYVSGTSFFNSETKGLAITALLQFTISSFNTGSISFKKSFSFV